MGISSLRCRSVGASQPSAPPLASRRAEGRRPAAPSLDRAPWLLREAACSLRSGPPSRPGRPSLYGRHSQEASWDPGPGALVEVPRPCLPLRSRSLAAAQVTGVPSGLALGRRDPRPAGALGTAAGAPLGGARTQVQDGGPPTRCAPRGGEPRLREGQGGRQRQSRRARAAGARPAGLCPRVPGNGRPASPALGVPLWTPD